jgi:GNAT superfamily N-acetyltransferase
MQQKPKPLAMQIRIASAQTDDDIRRCCAVLAELRPHVPAATFLERVHRMRQACGFDLAFVEMAGEIVAVAGYRYSENLAWGKFLYVDDLVTTEPRRGSGFGQRLFGWLVQQARSQGCAELHLDSGVQRFAAHRFYLARGMNLTCHHFALPLA